MIHIIASLALFAIRPALTAIQDQSMPPPSPEEQARIDEWNSYLAGERTSPPPFEGTRWSPPLRRDTIVRVLLGGRFADEDLAPLEELYTAAIEAGVHTGEPGLSIDLGFAYSRDDDDLIIS